MCVRHLALCLCAVVQVDQARREGARLDGALGELRRLTARAREEAGEARRQHDAWRDERERRLVSTGPQDASVLHAMFAVSSALLFARTAEVVPHATPQAAAPCARAPQAELRGRLGAAAREAADAARQAGEREGAARVAWAALARAQARVQARWDDLARSGAWPRPQGVRMRSSLSHSGSCKCPL